ncbi:MAG: transcriptional regulator [Crocinitomicaceae bacterium]|nr:transcriptional regulator [Crocinitomicaceae bacterium]
MEKYELKEDIRLVCERASSFPEDIMGAHQRLHSKITHGTGRKYFGISHPDPMGKIMYFAAVEELEADEAKKAGFETVILKKGTYISINVPDYMNNPIAIGQSFQKLITVPGIDPEGWCVEMYESKSDVRCMVRLQ